MNVQVYYLLGQTEGERKTFLRGCKKGGHIVRLPQEHLVDYEMKKLSPFVKNKKFSASPLLFIRPLYK